MASSQSGGKSSKGSRKKTNAKGEKIYCVCREPENGRFMIACDKCNEWYHGTCVSISKSEGKRIECYYCDSCTSATPNLKTIYKERKERKEPNTKGKDPNAIPQRCGDCLPCTSLPDCGTCTRCKVKNGRCLTVICAATSEKAQAQIKTLRKPTLPSEPKDEPKDEPKTEPKVEPKVEVKIEPKCEPKEEEMNSPPSTSRKAGAGGVAGSAKQPPKGKKKDNKGGAKRGGKDKQQKASPLVDRVVVGSEAYKAHMEKERKDFVTKRGPVQCHGVRCVTEARPNSKYCSDKCGMSRAKERLAMYLPKGVENYWKAEPYALKLERKEENLKEQQKKELNKEKAELDKWYNLAIDYVKALKTFTPDEKEDGKNDGDFVVACAVCSVEFGSKIIGRHMEKCYARSEKQSTYGTSSKCTVNPNGIFCDQFNKSNNSYCKRLRVICPEHYKGDIEERIQVCGYPTAWFKSESTTLERLFTSVDVIISEGYCGMARKDCKKHTGWIPLILGLIDNRRLTYFQKMEDWADKKSEKLPMGDALLLMSNHTEYHQPLEKIREKYEEEAKNVGETVMSTLL